jgi:RHS repeat-associated protein
LVSADGKTLLFTRSYGAYGEKSIKINAQPSAEQQKLARELEKLVIWGYAGLIELPWKLGEFSDARLYISQTRVYSPDAREWVSPDSYVKWNPQAAVTTPWDLHPFRYARNQPLDFVDPSGNAAHLGVASAGAIAAGFTTFGLTYMMTNNFERSALLGLVTFGSTFISISTLGLFTAQAAAVAQHVGISEALALNGLKGLHAAGLGALNSGSQYYLNGKIDYLGVVIGGYGGTFAGAGLKWGVSTGTSKGIAGVKGFLSSFYNYGLR